MFCVYLRERSRYRYSEVLRVPVRAILLCFSSYSSVSGTLQYWCGEFARLPFFIRGFQVHCSTRAGIMFCPFIGEFQVLCSTGADGVFLFLLERRRYCAAAPTSVFSAECS